MEHEPFFGIVGQCVDHLGVFFRSEGKGYQCLGFTTGEQCRAMCPGDQSEFDADGAHFVKLSSIETFGVIDDHTAHDLFFYAVDRIPDQLFVQVYAFFRMEGELVLGNLVSVMFCCTFKSPGADVRCFFSTLFLTERHVGQFSEIIATERRYGFHHVRRSGLS